MSFKLNLKGKAEESGNQHLGGTTCRQEATEEVYKFRGLLLQILPFYPLCKGSAGPMEPVFSVSGRQEGSLSLVVCV